MKQDIATVHRGVVNGSRSGPPVHVQRWVRFALAYGIVATLAAVAVFLYRPGWFVQAPALALLFGSLTASLALACGGQAYIHERCAHHDFVQHNEVGGFIIAVAGTLYAVLLGFLIAVAWQHFADARQLVAQESAAATDVWHAAIGIPQPERSRVRDDALAYAQTMVKKEWPEMRRGQLDTNADYIIMDGIIASGSFKPANLMESNSQVATVQQFQVLHDARQRRLAENSSGISAFEWLVLILGAVCIIAFCWVFGLVNQRMHLVMTATVTILVTSMLVLLFELQYPFRTDLRIKPDSWIGAIGHIRLMQTGSQNGMRM